MSPRKLGDRELKGAIFRASGPQQGKLPNRGLPLHPVSPWGRREEGLRHSFSNTPRSREDAAKLRTLKAVVTDVREPGSPKTHRKGTVAQGPAGGVQLRDGSAFS